MTGSLLPLPLLPERLVLKRRFLLEIDFSIIYEMPKNSICDQRLACIGQKRGSFSVQCDVTRDNPLLPFRKWLIHSTTLNKKFAVWFAFSRLSALHANISTPTVLVLLYSRIVI